MILDSYKEWWRGIYIFFFHISTCSCCQHPLKRISSFFFVLLLILNSIIRSIIHKDNERRADNNPLMKIFENHHIAITVFTHIVRRLANHGAQVVWRHWRHAIWLAYLSTLWCDDLFHRCEYIMWKKNKHVISLFIQECIDV